MSFSEDVLLGVTSTGNVFVWTLTGEEEVVRL